MDGSKRKPEGRRPQEQTRPRTPPSYEEITKFGHSLHVKKFSNEEVCLKNDYPLIIAYDPPPK
ncbi:cytoplasmic protein [Skunkpox virus]|uniref:Cytoplasmic protein n=1 Tax=Skunkpox virus TaxID=160796 RepID=A0A1C9KBJ3_9POXV|nr:cytoplasmic protein [Skunkpox virus]AOP31523.1 cytoplasmic protein [Skunkpox virus]